uniref:Uncharacterized protein n=1 Tax=Lotharella globosa TaxID=91324 RepID=A0A6V3QJU7_9EUKA
MAWTVPKQIRRHLLFLSHQPRSKFLILLLVVPLLVVVLREKASRMGGDLQGRKEFFVAKDSNRGESFSNGEVVEEVESGGNSVGGLGIKLNGCGHSISSKTKSKLVYATSSSSKVFNDMDWERTLFEKRNEDLPGEFWLFGEDSWDQKHGRPGMDLTKSQNPMCVFDIFERESWLYESMRQGGAIDQFYAYAGDMEPCDQPLKIKSGKLLVRKIAAMYHSLMMMEDGSTLIWLDTDVTIRDPVDELFLAFVRHKDITYIPFMSDPEWADRNSSAIDFKSLDDPFWRIESGLVAFTANDRSRGFLSEVLDMYRGGLLELAQRCLAVINEGKKIQDIPISKFKAYQNSEMVEEMCHQPWLKRNLYMDDIFSVTLTLHRHHHFKTGLKQGWFWMGCHRDCERCRNTIFKKCPQYCSTCPYKMHPKGLPYYVFPDTVYGSQPYLTPFNTVQYFLHHCGQGAYSKTFREGSKTVKSTPLWVLEGTDKELTFSPWERFNDTIEFRFNGESFETLHDLHWSIEARLRRQEAGLWPRHWPLVGVKKWWRNNDDTTSTAVA